ncbi:AsmA family protein [Desulfovibrio sulfodismutans]|uniref:AsmA family protein n=1 Tax=Desulfolutivibrio sulfodismutans TaxID=63561 RepID=A0A7K3NK33_9BACT|nr:AsmA family protein [Desulfolutivibrio sulfodismutans]NDY56566.1 AsmA family protein [Desulfolutivibrio sulfodismutans]QLA13103.1 AsmA family protein [Desulfolutivibrio sulfodismutans DSM 3696]
MSTPAKHSTDPEFAPARGANLRRRLRLAALLGLVLVAGFFALPQIVDLSLGQDKIKEYAELSLSQALGRKVTVGGQVRLSSFPWMMLHADDLTVADAPGFGSEPFLSVNRVTVDIRLLPLFSRIIMPGAITLISPTMHLKRDAADRPNWEGLPFFSASAAPMEALVSPENGDAPPKADAPSGWEVVPLPSGIRIQDAMVHYDDRRRGFSGALRHFTLATGRGERFDFHLSFDVTGLDPAVEAQIHAKGTAGFDAERLSLSVADALVEATLAVPGDERFASPEGGEPWRVTLRAAVDCDTAAGSLAVRDLTAAAPDAQLTGNVELTGLMEHFQATASFALRAALSGPMGQATQLAPLAAKTGESVPSAPSVSPDGKKRSFLDFSSRFLPAKPPSPLDDLTLTAQLSASADRISLASVSLHLRDASVTGRADYQFGPRPRLTADLQAVGLNLDRIPWGSGGQGFVLPLSFLTDAYGRITLDARDMTLGGVTLPQAALTAASEKGQFRLYPLSAITPEGILAADVRGEVRGQALDVTAEAEISQTPPNGQKTSSRPVQATTLVLTGTAEAARATGNLQLTAKDPLSVARILGQSEASASAMASPPGLSCKAAFTLTPGLDRIWDRLDFTGLEARLGPDVINGGVTVKNGPEKTVELGLHLETLEPDRLAALWAAMVPAKNGATADGAATNPGQADLPALPDIPALMGRISVGKATISGVEAKNLTVEGQYRQGKAEVTSLGGDLFGGKLSGRMEAGLTPGANRLAINATLAGADSGALTNRFLTGPCTLRLAAEAAGDSVATMLSALSGRVEAEMNRDLKPGRKAEDLPLAKIKAGVDFKAQHNGAPEAGRAFDLNASLTASGPASLREIKADARGVASYGKDAVQIGQGKLSGTATLAMPAEKGERSLGVAFGTEFHLDPGKGAFSARNITLEAGGTKGTGKLDKKGRDEGGRLSGAFDFPDINPRDLLPALGFSAPPHAASDDLRHGSLTFVVAENAVGTEIKGISLHLDDMRATGTVLLRSGLGRPKIELDVTHLDFDRYFPPQHAEQKPAPANQDVPIDLAALRSYDVEARIRFNFLKKGNLVWKNGVTSLSARGGVFSARHEAGEFYGGRFLADLKGDARDVVLKTSLDLQIDGFDAATFLKEWAEGDVLASGGATFVLAFKSNGLTERALRRNISGSARFQVTRGALKIRESGSPPPSSAGTGATGTTGAMGASEHQTGQSVPATTATKPAAEAKFDLLPFSVLSSSYAVREGVAITNDFLIQGKEMRVDGAGYVDLRDESIDLSVSATLESGAKVPATIRGPLEDPKLEIDRSKLFGDMVYRILKGIITMPGKALGKIFNVN